MTHPPILIKDLCLSFHHKVCFSDFTGQIIAGDRIAIIGFNGSGKSALLKLIQGKLNPTSGSIDLPKEITFGYVPQVIQHSIHLSGGQRLNKAITKALTGINSAGSKLACQPDVLLMDEPTNHLDSHNRARLMRMLTGYRGTLLIVSHDTELLRTCTDILWHIDNGKIQIFTGRYDDYLRETRAKRQAIEQQLARLRRDKKASHKALMKEQQRAAKSKAKGQKSIDQKKWPTWVSKTKRLEHNKLPAAKKPLLPVKNSN
jgi:ATPase subunit of ABC transporter with duplicated ATPase domains